MPWSKALHDFLWGLTADWIVLVGLFLTLGLQFQTVLRLPWALRLLIQAISRRRKGAGEISSIHAFTTALGGTMGMGHLSGMAVSLSIGGPGVVPWMWVVAMLGLATRYSETFLGVRFRQRDKHGQVIGGPMEAIEAGLGPNWKLLAMLYALCGSVGMFGFGNGLQAQQLSQAVHQISGLPPLAIAEAKHPHAAAQGLHRISNASMVVVPAMLMLYLPATVVLLALHAPDLPRAIQTMLSEAFAPRALGGGALALILRTAVRTATLTNDAGLGTTAISFAAAAPADPRRQGWLAMLINLISVGVCTATALVLMLSGVLDRSGGLQSSFSDSRRGLELLEEAFRIHWPGSDWLPCIAVGLFAFTTLMTFGFYGERCFTFLVGQRGREPFRLMWIGFAALASIHAIPSLWMLANLLGGLMVLPNLLMLLMLSRTVFLPSLLANAVVEGAKPTLLDQGLPFQQVLCLTALAYLSTLAASRLALRLRLPAMLGVLLLGLSLPGPVILKPEHVEMLDMVGLAMLLFYSGLNADLNQLRGLLRHGVVLAMVGPLLSSLLLGGTIWLVYAGLAALMQGSGGLEALPLWLALMAAACLSSTDATPALELLKHARLKLPPALEHTLRLESSLNAPLSMLIVLFLASLATTGAAGHGGEAESLWLLKALQNFLKGIGSGVMVGLILTYLGQFILRRWISDPNQILLLGVALALSSFGLAEILHGSGYIAAYVTGMFLANDIYSNECITPERLEHSLEPFNTLMECTIVLLFGSLIEPSHLLEALLPGLLVALALMLMARPLGVFALQRLSAFTRRERSLLAWCGLRGAAPLALTYTMIHTVPLLPGIEESTAVTIEHQLEGLIAVVVMIVLVVQGLSLPVVCRRLGLAIGS